jgi:hypothetical protein
VSGRFLDQLHVRGESEFGVNVGEVGLHRTWGYEKPRGDLLVAQAFSHEFDERRARSG